MAVANKCFDTGVFSGGGIKGIAELGALHYFFEQKMINIDTYCATSIGSAISLLLICGYEPMEIFREVYTMDSMVEYNDEYNIWNVIKNLGLLSINTLTDRISVLVKRKFKDEKGNGFIPTLLQLKELTGKVLIVTASNISKDRAEYFSPQSRPQLDVVDAVKISCSLPVIFFRIKYNDDFYGDGGLVDNFPIQYIDDGKRKILGLIVSGSDQSNNSDNVISYLYKVLMMPMNAMTTLRSSMIGENTHLVSMKLDNIGLMVFSMTSEKKMDMFMTGYYMAKKSMERQYLTVVI